MDEAYRIIHKVPKARVVTVCFTQYLAKSIAACGGGGSVMRFAKKEGSETFFILNRFRKSAMTDVNY